MLYDFDHEYKISSTRGCWDETDNTLLSDSEYEVGEVIWIDGIMWIVDEIIR